MSFTPAFIIKAGFTVIVKTPGAPLHPSADGVTVITASIGLIPLLVAVKEGSDPVPFVAKPISVLLLFQLNIALPTLAVKFVTGIPAPLQDKTFGGTINVIGLVLIVIVIAVVGDEQLFASVKLKL